MTYKFPVNQLLGPVSLADSQRRSGRGEGTVPHAGPCPHDECDECGHEIRLHGDKYGCEYEYGDWVVPGERGPSGSGYEAARGPCGCTAVTVHDDEIPNDERYPDVESEQSRWGND